MPRGSPSQTAFLVLLVFATQLMRAKAAERVATGSFKAEVAYVMHITHRDKAATSTRAVSSFPSFAIWSPGSVGTVRFASIVLAVLLFLPNCPLPLLSFFCPRDSQFLVACLPVLTACVHLSFVVCPACAVVGCSHTLEKELLLAGNTEAIHFWVAGYDKKVRVASLCSLCFALNWLA